MSSDGSITHWLGLLQAGDRDAAGPLWQHYFHLLVARARAALRGQALLGRDEEDVALSAFDSFCRAAEAGRFPDLNDRDGLWRLLLVFTARKASHLIGSALTQKRGGGRVRAETDLAAAGSEGDEGILAAVVGQEPSPELAACVAEECRRLLDLLDVELRPLAVWQLEGYSAEEIAARLGRSPRTAARKLAMIRELWRQEARP
jgi:hypothetical protein